MLSLETIFNKLLGDANAVGPGPHVEKQRPGAHCRLTVYQFLPCIQNLWPAFPAVTTDPHENMPLAKDLLHPSPEEEKRKHKKKRLVQSPNSYFMDVKCPGCYKITMVFSHAQTVVLCVGCSTVLCQPTGGKARLTEGCSFRRKQH
uniref:40S ribosomal protein S27-like n=3 Tax=Catarrhini TaxID=9526 RepID=UPI0010A2558D|nr:40S ribosomal protein S27-like [Macaca mulatta]